MSMFENITFEETLRITRGEATFVNCKFLQGLEIVNSAVKQHLEVIKHFQTREDVEQNLAFHNSHLQKELWGKSPKVVLNNCVIMPPNTSNKQNNSLWIGGYVREVKGKYCIIYGNTYLAGGSYGCEFTDSKFRGNVNIDGSFQNVFLRDIIKGNLETYKNCGETHGDNAGRPVITPADENMFKELVVYGKIHIASRQSKHVDHMECSDISPYPDNKYEWTWVGWWPRRLPISELYRLDYSKRNQIINCSVGKGIIVEDDYNIIYRSGDVKEGAYARAKYLNYPVKW